MKDVIIVIITIITIPIAVIWGFFTFLAISKADNTKLDVVRKINQYIILIIIFAFFWYISG